MNNPILSRALARCIVPWMACDWPLNWDALFPKAQPLVLEIGFGNGAFLLDQAKCHPQHNHVGIERSWDRSNA